MNIFNYNAINVNVYGEVGTLGLRIYKDEVR